MKTNAFLFFIIFGFSILSAQPVQIQENEIGFCSVDGQIVTSSSTISGWTGEGFADVDLGIGKSISWQITVAAEGDYNFQWQYACRNDGGDRDAKLLIDGKVAIDTVRFPTTGNDWSDWTLSSPLNVHLLPDGTKMDDDIIG